MLNSFLFKADCSERVEDWRAALKKLHTKELLWITLHDASEEKESAVCERLARDPAQAGRLRESPQRASGADDGEHLYVTLFAVAGEADAPVLVPIECVIGQNWVVSAHREEVPILNEFLKRAEGGGQIGELDAPSFVAAIGEWVIACYLRASRPARQSSRSWTRRSSRRLLGEMCLTSSASLLTCAGGSAR